MQVEGVVEPALFCGAVEAPVRPYVLRQLAADVVGEEALGETSEEVAGDGAKLLLGGELRDLAANVVRG